MSYTERVKLYQQIEKARKRPLIVYITSSRQGPGASGIMSGDMIQEFTKQLMQIPDDKKEIDILIVSNGGDPTVPWRVISMLREKFTKISALLPYAAFSAATLLALGTNEIVMHPFSNLGPVDPQLTYVRPRQQGQAEEIISFGSEDIKHFIEFVRKDIGITDQEQLEKAFEVITHDVGGIPIGVARRSSFLALEMGSKLLGLHMEDKNKAKAIAEALNTSFFYHGYPLSRTEASEIGLPVVQPNKELEELMWNVWEDVENEMECSKPFNPLEVVLNKPEIAALIAPVNQIQIPANLPAPILQQVLNNVLQQIQLVTVLPVDYSLFIATLESTNCKSEYRTLGKINAVRKPDMGIGINLVAVQQGWKYSKT